MRETRMWCGGCGQSWLTSDPGRLGDRPRCQRCGDVLRPDRRAGRDRRGALQRLWDPEERSWADRRAPAPPPRPHHGAPIATG